MWILIPILIVVFYIVVFYIDVLSSSKDTITNSDAQKIQKEKPEPKTVQFNSFIYDLRSNRYSIYIHASAKGNTSITPGRFIYPALKDCNRYMKIWLVNTDIQDIGTIKPGFSLQIYEEDDLFSYISDLIKNKQYRISNTGERTHYDNYYNYSKVHQLPLDSDTEQYLLYKLYESFLLSKLLNTVWLKKNIPYESPTESELLFTTKSEVINLTDNSKHTWSIEEDRIIIKMYNNHSTLIGKYSQNEIKGTGNNIVGKTWRFQATKIRDSIEYPISTENNQKVQFNSKISEKIFRSNIDYLYHMTHISNIENILKHGLVSHIKAHKVLMKKDISIAEVNDRRNREDPIYQRSLHNYVPLYFNPKNPMLYRRKDIQNDIVIIAVDKRVLLQKQTIFTDGNAASISTRFYKNLDNLSELDWKIINGEYWNDYVDGKRKKCAEVLVRERIENEAIKKIFCLGANTEKNCKSYLPKDTKIAVVKRKDFYFD
jgi:hypothetical protein